MAVQAGSPGRAAAFPPIPLRRKLYGFGSIYGKTIRDSRLAFIIAAGLLGGMALVMGVAVSNIFPTPAARLEVDALFGSIPESMMRLFGNVEADRLEGRHAGRLRHLQVQRDLRPRHGHLVDHGPVRDPGRRGASREPRLRRGGSVRQAAHRPREAGRPPDPALAGDGGPRPHDDLQLERLRGRRPRRPDPAAVRRRLRPLGRLHRDVLRRRRVRPLAAPRPRRLGRDRRPWDGCPVDHERPERRRSAAHPEPVQLDVRPRPARRHLRLAVACARGDRSASSSWRSASSSSPAATWASRPASRSPSCRRRSSASTGRRPGRSATSSPGRSRGGSASA